MKHNKGHDNTTSTGPGLGSVPFEFTRPTASAVWVAGTLNDRQPGTKSMHPSGDGHWRVACRCLLVCLLLIGACARGGPIVIGYTNCLAVANYSQSLMNRIAQSKWYFAHASVGECMMQGVANLHLSNTSFYQLQGISSSSSPPGTTQAGMIYDDDRGNPVSYGDYQVKLDLFNTAVNNGWHFPTVNLAMTKLCFIDIWTTQTSSTVAALLSSYLNTLTNLEAAYPQTVFVYATMPLTTTNYYYSGEDYGASTIYWRNVFNNSLRAWCSANNRVLLDLADIEAHDTNGNPTTFTYNGLVCQQLWYGDNVGCDAYCNEAGDNAHPTNPGAEKLMAQGFYAVAAATMSRWSTNGSAPLTVTGITANNKVYNGTTKATLQTNSAALVGVQGGDQVTLILTNAAGAFDTKAVGIGKTVTVSGLQIVGRDAGKYTLTQPTTTAAITAATLTVSGITANNKAYDGTTAAAIQTSSGTLLGKVNGDDVTLNTGGASGVFLDPIVGIGKPVTVSGLTISGADSGNYSLLQPAGISANVGVASLSVQADDKQRLYGETNPVFTASYAGFVNGQTFGTSGVIGNPSLSTTAVTGSLPGIYPLTIAVGSLSAVNYSFDIMNGTLTVTGSAAPFPISSVSLSNGVVLVSWAAVGGQTYRLQFKQTLFDSTWHDVVPDVAAAGLPGGDTGATAQDVVSNAPQRFYRVMLVK